MGSGDWFKNIINKKKFKEARCKKHRESASEKSNFSKVYKQSRSACLPTEDVAATRIQAAFHAFVARKAFRRLKGVVRVQALIQADSVTKQALVTLSYLHSWSKIQAEIKARRAHMVTEGRLRQKKLENQLKLEAKLHDLEVEWSGGSETMGEVLARIHQREEAAVKRERAMAYAFSHQWRANSNFGSPNDELGKTNWGWSWMDRWVAAQPWESRLPIQSSPKKSQSPKPKKNGKNTKAPTTKTLGPVKSISPSGKSAVKAKNISNDVTGKIVAEKVVENKEDTINVENNQVNDDIMGSKLYILK